MVRVRVRVRVNPNCLGVSLALKGLVTVRLRVQL